jgi:tetratricopeptide (TPR) repeat protein
MKAKEILEEAQRLYNNGEWQKAIDTIDENLAELIGDEDVATAGKIKGWSHYYLGIKGPIERKEANLLLAEGAFNIALGKTKERKTKISIMNGLPLVLWNLGRHAEASGRNATAIGRFPDEPSVWNTRSILLRWAQQDDRAVEVCEKVYELAMKKEDFLTAGHGKHNKADSLVKLGKTEEARTEYEKAIELYKKHEGATSKSAKFHVEGVQKKLAAL